MSAKSGQTWGTVEIEVQKWATSHRASGVLPGIMDSILSFIFLFIFLAVVVLLEHPPNHNANNKEGRADKHLSKPKLSGCK